MNDVLIEDRFLADVKDHQMTIIKEDGVHRHVRFAQPRSSCMRFDLITWPGHLCYTGDMGTYVFTRLFDMFEFFRRAKKDYAIDFRYWAEKVEAADKGDGVKKFSFEKFTREINDWIDRREEEYKPDDDEPEQIELHKAAFVELREAIKDDVLSADENDVRAFDAANDFEHSGDAWQAAFGPKSKFAFYDFWEVDLTEYTHRFVWCCYALAWGIKQYDAAKEASKLEEMAI